MVREKSASARSFRTTWIVFLGLVVAALVVGEIVTTGRLFSLIAIEQTRRQIRSTGGVRLRYAFDLDRAIERRMDHYAMKLTGRFYSAGPRADATTQVLHRGAQSGVLVTFSDAATASRFDTQAFNRVTDGLATPTRNPDGRTVRLDPTASLARSIEREILEVARSRLDHLGLSGEATLEGATMVIELPRLAAASLERASRILAVAATLEFKLGDDGSEYMKRLCAIASHRTPEFPSLAIGRDQWTEKGSGIAHEDLFLRASDRSELERFVASLPSAEAVPADRELGFEQVASSEGGATPSGAFVRTYYLRSGAVLNGELITDAEVNWDPKSGRPEVSLTFDSDGGGLLEKISSENVGRKMAIVLDGKISSAPVLESKIAGGRALITMGGFSDPVQLQQAAKDLVAVLRTGALPVELRLVSEQAIAPAR